MKKQTIKEIKALLETIHSEEDEQFKQLQLDDRKGVQKALSGWKKKREKQKQLIREYKQMSTFENTARDNGFSFIAGVDEVGRGPLAGPVVAAAVILPDSDTILGLNDSKKLSFKKREELFEIIHTKARAVGVGIVEAPEIDRINIYQASKKAMELAIKNLSIDPDYLLLDAMQVQTSLPQEKIIKGDARSVSIAAASIVAKVTRDRMMEEYDKEYPGYGFSNNAGYGTKEHLIGLKELGVTPIHRQSFAPVRKHSSIS